MNVIKLRKLREEKGLYQKEVASALGISKSRYTNYELGIREPDNQMLKQIAFFFNVSLDYLLDVTDEPVPLNKDSEPPYREKTLEESILLNKELSEKSKNDMLSQLRLVKIRDNAELNNETATEFTPKLS